MRIQVHPRISAKRHDITTEDVETSFTEALRSRARDTDPAHWVGVGMDTNGRLLEFIAVEVEPATWLVFHATSATKKVLNELGLGRK